MSRPLANVSIYVDTTQSWIYKTNALIDAFNNDVLVANTTGVTTGSALQPKFATLIGGFTSNTIQASNTFSVGTGFQANNTAFALNSTYRFIVGGTPGANGQVLTSTGNGMEWRNVTGTGTVTRVNSGIGLVGGPITNSGSLQVKQGQGIIVDEQGVSVDPAYIAAISGGTGSATLQGFTWASPAAIGSTTANTGVFTTATATTFTVAGGSAVLNQNSLTHTGFADFTTPSGTTGGLRVRARADNTLASIQITNNNGGTQWNRVDITQQRWTFSSDVRILGGIEVGFRTVPQLSLPAQGGFEISPSTAGGYHYLKSSNSDLILVIPDNNTQPCPIGTAITIVNDGTAGNISVNGQSLTQIQLAGTLTVNAGPRTIIPGGYATLLKIGTNKWTIAGPGVT